MYSRYFRFRYRITEYVESFVNNKVLIPASQKKLELFILVNGLDINFGLRIGIGVIIDRVDGKLLNFVNC